jgi:hypothetical protein
MGAGKDTLATEIRRTWPAFESRKFAEKVRVAAHRIDVERTRSGVDKAAQQGITRAACLRC